MEPVPSLTWGIKRSLMQYLVGPAMGSLQTFRGAEVTSDGVQFQASDDFEDQLQFLGSVLLTGHGSLMRIVFGDPAIELRDDATGILWVRVESGDRLPLAELHNLTRTSGGVEIESTVLRPEGVPVFGGQYPSGTLLDNPIIIFAPTP